MAPTPHRTVDASVFLEVYLQGTNAGDCEQFLNNDVSTDTILSDLTVGEAVLNLMTAKDDELVEEALPDFLRRIEGYLLAPLSPDCIERTRTEEFRELRGVQDKDKLLLAFAVEHDLTRFATLDRGLGEQQAMVDAICEQQGREPLRIEWPKSAKAARR